MVYVDALSRYPADGYRDARTARVGAREGHRWCHLYADSDRELHAFAARIGLKRQWAHTSSNGVLHYDLVPRRRKAAVAAGATELTAAQALELRRRIYPPGKGDVR
jgi:hypothetical protein